MSFILFVVIILIACGLLAHDITGGSTHLDD